MNRILSMLGLEARLRRLKIAAGEGAMAAEDRAQLLRMAWDAERQRLRSVVVLTVAVMALTTVTVALLSVAIVVHFWDSPHRATAAWCIALTQPSPHVPASLECSSQHSSAGTA